MALLYEDDYEYLRNSRLDYEEDENNRFLVIKNYPLDHNLYVNSGKPIKTVEVLLVIPQNYNTSGGDMFWVYPPLVRADGKEIPNAFGFGESDSRNYDGKEYCRWSRHVDQNSWKSKEDNIVTLLSRVEWALKNPDANK